MDVSITVSGSCHICLSREVYVEVQLSKNFGISTFDLSAFSTTVFIDMFTQLRFLLKTSKALESKITKGWSSGSTSFCSSVFLGGGGGRVESLDCPEEGHRQRCSVVEFIRAVNHAGPERRVTQSPVGAVCSSFNPQIFIYPYDVQRSMLGREGLASRLSPALQINQHLTRNLCFRRHSSYKSECQHSLINPNVFFCPYISAKLQLKWQWSPELINPLMKWTPILSFLTCGNFQYVLLKKKKISLFDRPHTATHL